MRQDALASPSDVCWRPVYPFLVTTLLVVTLKTGEHYSLTNFDQ